MNNKLAWDQSVCRDTYIPCRYLYLHTCICLPGCACAVSVALAIILWNMMDSGNKGLCSLSLELPECSHTNQNFMCPWIERPAQYLSISAKWHWCPSQHSFPVAMNHLWCVLWKVCKFERGILSDAVNFSKCCELERATRYDRQIF